MTLTAGALTQVSVGQQTASVSSAAATGGTGPYTYQWNRGATSGFTPAAGTQVAGATSLTLNDSGLVPNTQYYYKMVATDTGNGNATVTSSALAVATAAYAPQMNALTPSTITGQTDLRFSANVMSVVVDNTQTTPIYPGVALKFVGTTPGGVPKVVACTASSDDVAGFANYDVRAQSFNAGDALEMSLAGNCMYLWSTSSVNAGAKVQLDDTATSAVTAAVGSSGSALVGWAVDYAANPGTLIRVMLQGGGSGVLGSAKA